MHSPHLLAVGLAVVTQTLPPHLTPRADAEREPGWTLRLYRVEQDLWNLPRLAPDQTPNLDVVVGEVGLVDLDPERLPAPLYGTCAGFLSVDTSGEYRFRLTSDDGSRMWIDGRLAIDHDGRHGASGAESETWRLDAGEHEVALEWFDSGGAAELGLAWRPPGAEDFVSVPTDLVTTEADPTRVTSPGTKRLEDERRPGDGKPVDGVHPSLELTEIRPPGFEPKVGALAFLPDGRLVAGTFSPLQRDEVSLPDIESKPPDVLYALEGVTSGDPTAVRVRECATDVFEPMGLCVLDGELYVAHRRAVTRLTDRDGDGFFEHHEDVASGWEAWNYHQFTMGLVARDGLLYTALSTAMAPPGWEGMVHNAAPNGIARGAVLEIDPRERTWHAIAGGTRTPNGLGIGPGGALFYLDNQGTWMSTSLMAEVVPGRFFGHHNNTNLVPELAERFPEGGVASLFTEKLRAAPALFLPQNECANSPTEALLIEEGPYTGQMLLGELTAGGIRRASLERVHGHWQGAVFRFTQGLESGVNRMRFGPDGALYVGGIGAGGNWNWRGTQFGLQRLAPTGEMPFEMLAVSAIPHGFRIRFTEPVDPAWLTAPEHYTVRSWRYEHTSDYGGPKLDTRVLEVSGARASEDGLEVELSIPGLREGECVHLHLDPTSVDGEPIWSTEAWYTLVRMPVEGTEPILLGSRELDPRDASIGIGAEPPADGAVWIGRDGESAWVRDEDGAFVSRASLADVRLHLEWFADTDAGGPVLEIERGLRLELEASTPGWHALDLWYRAPVGLSDMLARPARVTACVDGRPLFQDELVAEPRAGRAPAPIGDRVTGRLVLSGLALDSALHAGFRNLWVASLEPLPSRPGAWIDLVPEVGDAELVGWTVVGGEATFACESREDGPVIVGESRPNTRNTFLVTDDPYGDFELCFEVRQDAELNSGVQVRSRAVGGDGPDGPIGFVGYQVELDPSERAWSGGLYDEGRRGWLDPLDDAPAARAAYRPGAWNRVRVVARGPSIRTWVNGVPAGELFDAVDVTGRIGLQVHGVGEREEPLRVEWRRIRIRAL